VSFVCYWKAKLKKQNEVLGEKWRSGEVEKKRPDSSPWLQKGRCMSVVCRPMPASKNRYKDPTTRLVWLQAITVLYQY